MTIYYTVDRAGHHGMPNPLSAGLVITASESFNHLPPNIATHLSALLPGDYSRHGKQYLIDNIAMTNHAGHPMEIILELIRQRDYPTKPSRLQSAFGCLSLSDADSFRKLNNRFSSAPIFEISPLNQQAHVADMHLLSIACPAHEYLNKCHLYWRELPGQNPFWEAVIPLPATVGNQVA
ncbi:hypothetical protein GQ182_003229 [Salmonella enterica]|nr:hypothetical protein [Salmonella enterica]